MNVSFHNWRAGALRFYQFIAEQSNVLNLPIYSDEEFIDAEFDKTTNRAIDRSSAACIAVINIYGETPVTAREYTRTIPGGRMPRSGNNRCKKWLKGYYSWLKNQYEPIVIPVPVLPKLPELAGLPGGADIKRSFQVTALVVIGVVLLIVYMMTGKGKKGVTVVT